MIWLIGSIVGGVIIAAGLVLTLLPLIRSGWYVVRACDFPRVQIASVVSACTTLTGLGWLVGGVLWARWLAAVGVVVVGMQLAQIVRYTRLWPKQVEDADGSASRLRLFIANVDYTNGRYEDVSRALCDADADVLLLVEANEPWESALTEVSAKYSTRLGEARDDGLGLVLYSRVPIEGGSFEHLVSDDRGSVHGRLCCENGARLRFVALHPTPPALDNHEAEGRTNSRQRDAELVVVAKHIRDEPEAHWIVFGDLNDVAWSHTTRLFGRLSGLNDPRVGRKLLNTFHAQVRWMRYPLDHVFVSPKITLGRLERVRLPGSDHFGVLIEIGLPKADEPGQAGANGGDASDAQDRAEAERIEDAGKSAAE